MRGALPDQVTCPETKVIFEVEKGTVPKRSHYTCGACGTVQDLLTAVRLATRRAMAAYAVQAYAPKRDAMGKPYGGRYFAAYDTAHARQYDTAFKEWEERKDADLKEYWPRSAIPIGAEIGPHDVEGHHYSHWWTMFNPRQLLVQAQLLKAIVNIGSYDWEMRVSMRLVRSSSS